MDYDNLILGVDIGAKNTGWSLANLTTSGLAIVDCGCIHVEKKEAHYKGTEKVLEAAEMISRISSTLFRDNIKAIAIETPGGNTQSASAAKALGACSVLVGHLYNFYTTRTVLVTPIAVKKIIKDKGPVTKHEVINYVINKYDVKNAPRKNGGDYLLKSFEHIADSIVVLEAALRSSTLFKRIIENAK